MIVALSVLCRSCAGGTAVLASLDLLPSCVLCCTSLALPSSRVCVCVIEETFLDARWSNSSLVSPGPFIVNNSAWMIFLINLLIMFKVSYAFTRTVSLVPWGQQTWMPSVFDILFDTLSIHSQGYVVLLLVAEWNIYTPSYLYECAFFPFWGPKTRLICNQLVNSLTLLDPGESISFRVETNSNLWRDLKPKM